MREVMIWMPLKLDNGFDRLLHGKFHPGRA
jgi:hypothetical protein